MEMGLADLQDTRMFCRGWSFPHNDAPTNLWNWNLVTLRMHANSAQGMEHSESRLVSGVYGA
jgi:hypothetical protein